jgi:hypothetical protein
VAADGTGAHPLTSMHGFIAGTGISAITGDPSWGLIEFGDQAVGGADCSNVKVWLRARKTPICVMS